MNRIDVSDSVELRDQYDDWFVWVPFWAGGVTTREGRLLSNFYSLLSVPNLSVPNARVILSIQ